MASSEDQDFEDQSETSPVASNNALTTQGLRRSTRARKATRHIYDETIDDEQDNIESQGSSPKSLLPTKSTKTVRRKVGPGTQTVIIDMPQSTLWNPRSDYEPFHSDAPSVSEKMASSILLQKWKAQDQQAARFVEFELDDFVVYQEEYNYPAEMRPLSDDVTKKGAPKLYFNGVLSIEGKEFFVRNIPIFSVLAGDPQDSSQKTVRHSIWIRSTLNKDRLVLYKLGRPATEYARFYEPYLWVADLAKHFVDYIAAADQEDQSVTIDHFRSEFGLWLDDAYAGAPEFAAWKAQLPSHDFRCSVVASIAYLQRQAERCLGLEATSRHLIWDEVFTCKMYKPFTSTSQDSRTVVSQYIYDCFADLPFSSILLPLQFAPNAAKLHQRLLEEHGAERLSPFKQKSRRLKADLQSQIKDIKPGDTISTPRDGEGTRSKWKQQVSKSDSDTARWFALVQKVHQDDTGKKTFDVLWLYRPVDTICGVMRYPWDNELFLSNHCSCADRAKISEDEVIGVHSVEFGGNENTEQEFFCRLTYIHKERLWVTLKEKHRRCQHHRAAPDDAELKVGDTRLVHLNLQSTICEPCELVEVIEGKSTPSFRFRRLLRRHQVDPCMAHAPKNELVYTQQFVEVKRSRIQGPCHIRFIKAGEKIPTPYDLDGVGCCFFITHEEVMDENLTKHVPLSSRPKSLRQGFDPLAEVPKLRGLDLFCGGGNFGRGLEEGGSVEMKWINDIDHVAVHTYMANAAPESVSPFLGSIDDFQKLVFQGKFSSNVPSIGEVDFISAGSPCPGFSMLTNDKTTSEQRKNQSLVASFASAVDIYRPRYGLLENVSGIVQKTSAKDQDVLSQLVCAVVGLGYQARIFLQDASASGAPQMRSRVFLLFAAPGCELPRRPPQTHSHPPGMNRKGLGNLPNGLPLVEREMSSATPFAFVPAEAACGDLPDIQDGKPGICVPVPDHRVSIGMTRGVKARIARIPIQPWGMNFALAWFGMDKKQAGSGAISEADRTLFPAARVILDPVAEADEDLPNALPSPPSSSSPSPPRAKPRKKAAIGVTTAQSSAFGRQDPQRVFSAVTTRPSVVDAKTGRQLHWREPRTFTVMEARRAQGFREEDVLLGPPKRQYRIVGNSVARQVAVAIGVEIRVAWEKTVRNQGQVEDEVEIEEDVSSQVVEEEEEEVRESVEDTEEVQDLMAVDDAADVVGEGSETESLRGNSGPPPALAVTPESSLGGSRKRKLESTELVETFAHKLRRLGTQSLKKIGIWPKA